MGTYSLIFLATSFVLCQSAPTDYDQRQDGKVNVHADLQNFLLVFATSDSTNFLNELAAQALVVPALRHGSSKEEAQADPTTAKYEVEDTQDKSKEPYRVEIVRIERDEEKKPRKAEPQAAPSDRPDTSIKNTPVEIVKEIPKATEKPPKTPETEKRGRSLRAQAHGRAVDEDEKTEVEDKRRKGEVEDDQGGEREKGGKARNVWTRVADPGRPGQSLKKELSKKEHEKNDVGASQSKPQELMLLGDGIENCGPGRFRDRAGVCQVDESFN